MKAFVSYSFIDSELYLITLMFEQLRRGGYVVETSSAQYPAQNFDVQKIVSSNFFIGIVTNNSLSVNHVIQDWNVAKTNNIQNVLLIENGVRVDNASVINFIRFDRRNPQQAINQLFNLNTGTQGNSPGSTMGGALVAGGILVGIAALIALLSSEDK